MKKILLLFPIILLVSACSMKSVDNSLAPGNIDTVTSATKTTDAAKQSEFNYPINISSEDAISLVQNADSKATIISSVLDESNDKFIYQIEFISNDSTYRVLIDANTGDIMEWKLK